MVRGRNWSMDQYFIGNVNALIQAYVDADFQDNMEAMFKSVKNLEIVISPKVEDTEDEHQKLTWIRDNMSKIFVYDSKSGKIVGMNPHNMNVVRKMLDETYRSLLMKLEKEKIYTAEVEDPRQSMGRFGGS
jgi:hypothetical protein